MFDPETYGVGMGYAIIVGAVILAVMIYTVIAVRKQVSDKMSAEKDPAMEVLKKRYERGEMSEEDYQRKKKRLEKTRRD